MFEAVKPMASNCFFSGEPDGIQRDIFLPPSNATGHSAIHYCIYDRLGMKREEMSLEQFANSLVTTVLL